VEVWNWKRLEDWKRNWKRNWNIGKGIGILEKELEDWKIGRGIVSGSKSKRSRN